MKGYGLLQVYTGSGKGKTTAALGVALRAAGRGARTVMLSFLKDDPDYGEAMAAQYLPHFLLRQVGRDAFVNFHNPDPIDLKMVREGWEEAKKIILEDTADLLILDEPTNHLDQEIKKALAKAIKNYSSSAILVCHEPDFYQELVDHIIKIENCNF